MHNWASAIGRNVRGIRNLWCLGYAIYVVWNTQFMVCDP